MTSTEQEDALKHAIIVQCYLCFDEQFWKTISDKGKSFVTELLQKKDQKDRKPADQIAQHAWLSSSAKSFTDEDQHEVFFMIGSQ
jgi:hypothetical protein